MYAKSGLRNEISTKEDPYLFVFEPSCALFIPSRNDNDEHEMVFHVHYSTYLQVS